jgi:hypothetical protein
MTKLEPMKPAPPVTSMFFIKFDSPEIGVDYGCYRAEVTPEIKVSPKIATKIVYANDGSNSKDLSFLFRFN